MRTLSEAARRDQNAPECGTPWLALLTIEHDDLADPIRVVNNTVNISSRGETYVGLPFDIILPSEKEDEVPRATLTVCNVSQQIGEALDSISSAPTISVEIIRASAPDTVEIGLLDCILRNYLGDVLEVSGELVYEPNENEPFPGDTFTPALFSGLF